MDKSKDSEEHPWLSKRDHHLWCDCHFTSSLLWGCAFVHLPYHWPMPRYQEQKAAGSEIHSLPRRRQPTPSSLSPSLIPLIKIVSIFAEWVGLMVPTRCFSSFYVNKLKKLLLHAESLSASPMTQ
jgi:hypothetical protein